MTLAWHVYIDFDNDLDFTDTLEDVTEYVQSIGIQRGTSKSLNAGQLTLNLLNADERFTPGNTLSPYSTGCTVGRRVLVIVEDGTTADFLEWDTLDEHWDDTYDSWPPISLLGLDVAHNGGFESSGTTDLSRFGAINTFDGWHGDAPGTSKIEAEYVTVHGGSIACKVTKSILWNPSIYSDMSVVPGWTYVPSLWHLGSIQWTLTNSLTGAVLFDSGQITSEVWTQSIAGDIVIPTACSVVRLTIVTYGVGASVLYVDDVTMIPSPRAMFFGFIENITPEMVTSPERNVTVRVKDLLRILGIRKTTLDLQIGQTSGQLVNTLLNSFGWEGLTTLDLSRLDAARLGGPGASLRMIDAGQTVVPYIQYDDQAVAAALREILDTEHGQLWIRGDGWPVFEDRHNRLKKRTSSVILTDDDMAELVSELDDGSIGNHIEVSVSPRRVGTPGSVIWSARCEDAPQELAVGETKKYYLSYMVPDTDQSCEATDLISPTATTDFVAASAEDGSGADMTGYLAVTLVTERGRSYLSVAHTFSAPIYLTKLQLRATPLIADEQITVQAIDGDSVAQYLERDQRISSRLMSDQLQAQSYADYLLSMNKMPRLRVKKLRLDPDQTRADIITKILTCDISDRIALQSDAHPGVDGDYFIESIQLETEGRFELPRLKLELSAVPGGYFVLNIDVLDGASTLAY